jgi:cytochrome P450
VVLHYTSACRDELAFGASAGEFDVGRTVNPHLAFGFGPHYCIGAALARLEIRLTLEALLDRYSSIELAGAVERTPSAVIAGIRHVPILLRP